MNLYGILYFTIAAVLSVIGTYAEWKNDPYISYVEDIGIPTYF